MSGKTGVVVALALTGVVLAMALFFAILYLQQHENYAHGFIRETLLRNGTDVASPSTTDNNTKNHPNDFMKDDDDDDIEKQGQKQPEEQHPEKMDDNSNGDNIINHNSTSQISENSSSRNTNLPSSSEPVFCSNEDNNCNPSETEIQDKSNSSGNSNGGNGRKNIVSAKTSNMSVVESINNNDQIQKMQREENSLPIKIDLNDKDQTEENKDEMTAIISDLETCMLPVVPTTRDYSKSKNNEISNDEGEEIEMVLTNDDVYISLHQGEEQENEKFLGSMMSKPKTILPIILNRDNGDNNTYCPSELTESQPATPPPTVSPINSTSNNRRKKKNISIVDAMSEIGKEQTGEDGTRPRGLLPPPWFSGVRDVFTPGSWGSSKKSPRPTTSFGYIGRGQGAENTMHDTASSASSFPEGMTCDERRNRRQLEQDFLDSDTPQPFLLASSSQGALVNLTSTDNNNKMKIEETTTPYKIQSSDEIYGTKEKKDSAENIAVTKNDSWPSPPVVQESPRSILKIDNSSQTQQQHTIDRSSGRMMIRFDTNPVLATESSTPKNNKDSDENTNNKHGHNIRSHLKPSSSSIHHNSANSDGDYLDDNALATQTEESYPWHYLVTDSNSIAGSVGKYSDTRLALLRSIEEENKSRKFQQQQKYENDALSSSSCNSKSFVSESEKEWYEKMACLSYKFDPKDESVHSGSALSDCTDENNHQVIIVPPPKFSLSKNDKSPSSRIFKNHILQTVEEHMNLSSTKETSNNLKLYDHIATSYTDGEEEEDDYDDHLARLISSSDLNDSYHSKDSVDRRMTINKITGDADEQDGTLPLHAKSISRFDDIDDPRLTAASALAMNSPHESNSSSGANSNPNAPSCHSSSIVSSANASKESSNNTLHTSKNTSRAYNKYFSVTAAERKRQRDSEEKLFEKASTSILASTLTSENETILDIPNDEEWEEEATNRMIYARKQASRSSF